jgi:hypothetical protein
MRELLSPAWKAAEFCGPESVDDLEFAIDAIRIARVVELFVTSPAA